MVHRLQTNAERRRLALMSPTRSWSQTRSGRRSRCRAGPTCHSRVWGDVLTLMSASKVSNLAGLERAVLFAHGGAGRRALRGIPMEARWATGQLGATATLAAWRHGDAWLADVLETLDHNRQLFERLGAELLPDVRWVAPQAGYLGWLDFGGLGLGDDPAKALLERGGSRTAAGPPSGPRGAASRGSTRAPRLPFSTRSCDAWCRVYRPSEATRGGDVRFDARHTVVLGSGFAWGHGVRGWVARKRAARGRGVVAGRRRAG